MNSDNHDAWLFTLSELIGAQPEDAFYGQSFQSVKIPVSAFTFDKIGIVLRNAPIDRSVQKPVPTSLRGRLFQQARYSRSVGHNEQRKMYNSLRGNIYWPLMATKVYCTVNNRSRFPRIGTKLKHHRQLELFPPAGPLKLASINIPEPQLGTKTRNHFVVVITDRYSQVMKAIPTANIASTQVGQIFFYDWVMR